MQMKYLSLALAAALATTLTACGGSDNKSNYNKDTLTPVTKPDGGNTGGTTDGGNTGGTTDGGNTNTNTDGGNTNTDGTNDQTEEGGNNNSDSDNDNESGDGTETPGPDPVNNPGNAAYSGNATSKVSTVGQQYRRGETANFDRPKNESLSGNATVFSWKRLANQSTTNIVNGRETVELKASPLSYRRYTGENTVGKKPDIHDEYSIQKVNGGAYGQVLDTSGAKSVAELYARSESYNPQDKLTGEHAADFMKSGHIFYRKGRLPLENGKYLEDDNTTEVDVTSTGANPNREPWAQPSNNNIQGFFADTGNNLIRNRANNGLVKIESSLGGYRITGQEDQVVTPDAKNKVLGINTYGQNSPTRVFGKLYNVNDSDYTSETTAKTAANTANSWVFLTDQVFELADDSSKNAKVASSTSGYKSVQGTNTANASEIGKHSQLAVYDRDQMTDPVAAATGGTYTNAGKGTYGLAAKAIKLNHVQYGRVTSNINALDDNAVKQIMDQTIDKQAFFHAPYRNKFNYNVGDNLKSTQNNTVDTYYYRGVEDGTSLEDMAKLPASGEYIYNGHATSYGLDNSFHGSQSTGGTNSFAFGEDKVGLGNFVQAKLDLGTKKVDGFIYNAWLSDIDKDKVVADKLVLFQGNVVGNSIVQGTAKLGYTPKDPTVPVEGAFKGSFYGSKAEEMGGAVNSIQEGYGNAEWGSVFGAQRRAVSDGNANQID